MPSASVDRCAAFEGALRAPPDTRITLEKHTWKVDSSLLSTKSQAWAEIIDNKDWEAGHTGTKTINLERDDPYVFAHLLQYLYYGKYNVDPLTNVKPDGITNLELGGASVSKLISAGRRIYAEENQTEEATIYPKVDMAAVHIEVYLLAEKYRIPELTQMSLDLFGRQKISTCNALVAVVNGNIGRASIELKMKIAYFVGEVFQEVAQAQTEAAKEVFQWLTDKYFCLAVMRSMSNSTEVLKKERDEACVEVVQPPVKKARR